jgi:SAM-dependent methyltransferase
MTNIHSFNQLFYVTELLRYKYAIHIGKKKIIKYKVLKKIRNLNVLDFGCGGGNFSNFIAESCKITAVDNLIAIEFASIYNPHNNIEYVEKINHGNNKLKFDATLFLDSLEFTNDMIKCFEEYSSELNFIIMPNFSSHSNKRIYNPIKRIILSYIGLLENKAFHKLYKTFGNPKHRQDLFLDFLKNNTAFKVKITYFNRTSHLLFLNKLLTSRKCDSLFVEVRKTL